MAMRVSILIPCYNARKWIGAAIDSALAQTWPDKEVIVFDDGSTDGSCEVIRSFGDRVRFEAGPNRGGNAARNRLLELSTGEWLQYLDADDWLMPDHVECQMSHAQANVAADAVYSPITLEHWPDASQPGSAAPIAVGEGEPRRQVLAIEDTADPWILLIRWRLPQTGATLWRRCALVRLEGWKLDQPCCQEHELHFRMLAACMRYQFNPTSGAVYRQWSPTTVCRRDPLNTFRHRLEIVGRAEEHLKSTGRLSADRRQAVALARLECARSLYHLDRAAARSAAQQATTGCPSLR